MREAEPNISQEKEPLDAKSLFDMIIDIGHSKSQEEIRDKLEKEGAERESAEFAIKMMTCLGAVNYFTFGDKVNMEFRTEGKEKPANIIEYIPASETEKEKYSISVDYFYKTIKYILDNKKRHILLDANGEMIDNPDAVSEQELLLGIAVHEARHRLQKTRNVKMFPRDENFSAESIDEKSGVEESDAIMVERLALGRIHYQNTSIEDLCDLIKINSAEQ